MRKFILYGILVVGLHLVKPVVKTGYKVTKKAAHVVYKVAV